MKALAIILEAYIFEVEVELSGSGDVGVKRFVMRDVLRLRESKVYNKTD